jgi:hypothetical protein
MLFANFIIIVSSFDGEAITSSRYAIRLSQSIALVPLDLTSIINSLSCFENRLVLIFVNHITCY